MVIGHLPVQILLWAPRFFGKNENLLGIQTKRRLAAVSSSSPCEGSRKHDRYQGKIGYFFAPNWRFDKTGSAGKQSTLSSSKGDADVFRERGFHPHSARCGEADGITRGSQS